VDSTGVLSLTTVRSQFANGTLEMLDTTAAREAPGVVDVLTAADLPAPIDGGRPVLASGQVRFQGQELAAVVAVDDYLAADAAELVDVSVVPADDYPPQPTAEDRRFLTGVGDATVQVAQARWHLAPLQTNGCTVTPGDQGRLQVRVPVRDPERFRSELAFASGLAEAELDVLPTEAPGRSAVTEDVVYPGHVLATLAARRTGRAVRWSETRSENLTSGGGLAGFSASGRITMGDDGSVRRVEVAVTADTGAYEVDDAVGEVDAGSWPHWYGLGDISLHLDRQRSSTPPARTAGVGTLAAVLVVESLIATVARKRGMDEDALRKTLAERGGSTAAFLLATVQSGADTAPPADPLARQVTGYALAPGVAAAAVVEMVPGTGEWRLVALSLALPAGVVRSSTASTVMAGAVDGYGLASMQEMPFDDQGNPLAATFMDYVMPTSWETPEITITGVPVPLGVSPSRDDVRMLSTAASTAAIRSAVARLLDPAKGVADGVLSSSAVWERAAG
jgi:CO/xanthine dehydrogenase Mo-binding subunit